MGKHSLMGGLPYLATPVAWSAQAKPVATLNKLLMSILGGNLKRKEKVRNLFT